VEELTLIRLDTEMVFTEAITYNLEFRQVSFEKIVDIYKAALTSDHPIKHLVGYSLESCGRIN
jgi:hypothetical protein